MARSEATLRQDTIHHRLAECPACHGYIWAWVVVESRTSAATLTADGKASVYASARPVSMTVSHECGPEGDDSAPEASASEVSASDEGVSS